jgi:hypothetical protein
LSGAGVTDEATIVRRRPVGTDDATILRRRSLGADDPAG